MPTSLRLALLASSTLLMAAPAHAAWLHACPAAQLPAGVQAQAKATGADGKPLAYFVDAAPRHPGCATVPLDLPAAGAVESLYPLDPGEAPAATIVLLGDMRDGRFAAGEHELPASGPAAAPGAPGAAGPRDPMPLRANLLAGMRVRAFGVEERVQVQRDGARLRVTCRPGKRAAGVVLAGPWYLPRADVVLAARAAGDALAFTWQVADAARVARDDAFDLTPLAGAKETVRLALPARLERGDWRQFVLLCPESAATLQLDTLALEPASAPKTVPRATWVWRPGDWIDNGAPLLDWAAANGIGALFVTVPLKDGAAVRAPDLLADFVRAAGKRGVKVYSVDGDPHMVLAQNLPDVVQRAQAYAAYNAAAAPDARLAGMQFDVEPYLLPASDLPPSERDARYIAMARALKDVAQASGTLELEFVVPFWWGKNRALLDGLAPYADRLAVMDYRTDPGQVVEFAVPFLDWAQAHGREARIALEAGSIDAQTQRRYVRAAAGEAADLVAADIGGRQVLALLRAPVPVPAAAGAQPVPARYRLAGSRVLDGSATTFHADKAALLQRLPAFEADFGAWPGFGGVAVHELR